MALIAIRRALVSVSDKAGVVELAQGLARHGVELLSTGGTYKTLRNAGLPVTEIADYTGFPEMLDGRVKTLHPKVHGGILQRRDVPSHLAEAAAHQIPQIDLVVVNLYPFEKTVAKEGVRLEDAIEQIDIGGPSMIRSAAKNHSHVAVLTDPTQYAGFVAELDANGGKASQERLYELAVAAFARTARYDQAINAYLSAASTAPATSSAAPPAAAADQDLPDTLALTYERKAMLRYGENPHQKAAFYIDPSHRGASLATARQLHGKELSYNNLLDLDAALTIARDFERPAAIVIKHNNPCGAAVAETLAEAFRKAYEGDPLSAFGSVLGFNRPIDKETAQAITEPGRFVEAIIAPSFDPEAFEILTTVPTWKANVRLLEVGDLEAHVDERLAAMQMRPLEGGLLRQAADLGEDGFADRKIVTNLQPNFDQLRDLAFGWRIVKSVKSNAIVLVRNESLVGVGAGQMSRVDSVQIAKTKAGERAHGSILASDAFFPFRDNVDLAAEAGVSAIVQPGGSKRDQESIDACNEHGIIMLFTGMRHFKH